jgi:U4/U6.U5 tri-snRNP-associated protein 2
LAAGYVGLNNLKFTDYVNVVVQALCHVTPLRSFLCDKERYSACTSLLVQKFGELVRKLWSSRNFKSTVCSRCARAQRSWALGFWALGAVRRRVASRCQMCARFVPCACCVQVSPHELLQAITVSSKKAFKVGKQHEAIDFTSWFLNQLEWCVAGGVRRGMCVPLRLGGCFLQLPLSVGDPWARGGRPSRPAAAHVLAAAAGLCE